MRPWLIFAGLALAGAALAQDIETDPATGRTIQYRTETVIDVEDPTLIDATLVGPEVRPLLEPRAMRFDVMATVRTNFDAELRASVAETR